MSYEPLDKNMDANNSKISRTPLVCGSITLLFGILFFGLIFGGPPLMDYLIFQGLVQQRLITSANSSGYDQWQSNYPSTGVDPEYFSVYLFNVTNPDEILKGAKPKLQEIGPFVYYHYYEFFDIKFSEDQNTVDAKRFETYIPFSGDPKNTYVTVADISYAAVRATADPKDLWYTSLAFDLLASAADAKVSSLFFRNCH